MSITTRYAILVTFLLMGIAAGFELAMGRSPICACGYVAVWHGALDNGNSQHLLDWYSPSHLIHGLIFYALGQLILRRWPVQVRFVLAVAIECAWEMAENSPFVIDRYRTATMALGYSGDSIVNSMSDVSCMMLGFLLARSLPVAASILLAVGFELLTMTVIRDGLLLNVIMLLWPIDVIRTWQAGLTA